MKEAERKMRNGWVGREAGGREGRVGGV